MIIPLKTQKVAPRGGAWIEIVKFGQGRLADMSPLAEGRGLKYTYCNDRQGLYESPLAEGRGLK